MCISVASIVIIMYGLETTTRGINLNTFDTCMDILPVSMFDLTVEVASQAHCLWFMPMFTRLPNMYARTCTTASVWRKKSYTNTHI